MLNLSNLRIIIINDKPANQIMGLPSLRPGAEVKKIKADSSMRKWFHENDDLQSYAINHLDIFFVRPTLFRDTNSSCNITAAIIPD